MKIKIYADTSDLNQMINLCNKVDGFTTNPTLMKKFGVTNYLPFVHQVINEIKKLPVSFEIFADDYKEMKNQILKLANISNNIYVKIPIKNTKNKYTYKLIKEVNDIGIKLNVTAVFTKKQIYYLNKYLNPKISNIISIFSGRIADTGVNPINIVKYAIKHKISDNCKILWASTREVYNIYQAEKVACDIITVTPEILNKLSLKNKNLDEYSLETVKMFHDDAKNAGYIL